MQIIYTFGSNRLIFKNDHCFTSYMPFANQKIVYLQLLMIVLPWTAWAGLHNPGVGEAGADPGWGQLWEGTIILPGESLSGNADRMVFPLKRAGNLILLEAIVGGIHGNLILDTGSSSMVLNSIWFGGGGRSLATYAAGGITGSAGMVSRMIVDHMQISGLEFQRVGANLVDLGHIESARNVKILGFFGLNLFREFEMVLDLRNSVMELHRLNFRGNRANREASVPAFDISMPIIVESDVVFIEADIQKSRLTFCLDTGAETSVIASDLPGKLLSTISVQRRSTLRGAGPQQVEVLHGILDELVIGKTKFKQIQVLVTNLSSMSKFFGTRIHGMLGCEFFEKGVFYINIKRQTMGIVLH